MAENEYVIVDKADFTKIANAVRNANGTANEYSISELADAVANSIVPPSTEPNQMLITDGDGITKWQEQLVIKNTQNYDVESIVRISYTRGYFLATEEVPTVEELQSETFKLSYYDGSMPRYNKICKVEKIDENVWHVFINQETQNGGEEYDAVIIMENNSFFEDVRFEKKGIYFYTKFDSFKTVRANYVFALTYKDKNISSSDYGPTENNTFRTIDKPLNAFFLPPALEDKINMIDKNISNVESEYSPSIRNCEDFFPSLERLYLKKLKKKDDCNNPAIKGQTGINTYYIALTSKEGQYYMDAEYALQELIRFGRHYYFIDEKTYTQEDVDNGLIPSVFNGATMRNYYFIPNNKMQYISPKYYGSEQAAVIIEDKMVFFPYHQNQLPDGFELADDTII